MPFLYALHDIPLSRKLVLSILGTSGLSVLAVSIFILIYSAISERNQMLDELTATATMVGENSTAALVFADDLAAQETLRALKVRDTIEAACLYREDSGQFELFADYVTGNENCPATPLLKKFEKVVGGLIVEIPIQLRGNTIGLIHLHQNYDDLWQAVNLYILVVLLAVVISLIVAWLLALNLEAWLSAPILELTNTANKISETGDYRLRAKNYGEDEVGQLIHRFNEMLSQIDQQNIELIESRHHLEDRVAERTQEIEEAMRHLKSAQHQLIQTEKLAALGGLVAGVAHEINTPVGVGMTASTSLYDYSKEIMEALDTRRLTKAGLEDYVVSAMEASDIIQKNLSRAADLVRSFKQVAIDQSGLEKRRINVAEYLQSILTSLHPEIKKTELRLHVDCPDDLQIETYPGALSQVITNMIMNSIKHGYEAGDEGNITIKVNLHADTVRLDYADDGKGIEPEHLSHVFEPFFTTRRNEGGSGLGMHVLHNIVTQTLNGSINLTSKPGQGVQISILMPSTLPKRDARYGESDGGSVRAVS